MKKVKVFLAIMCLATFTILNVSALFTEVEATVKKKVVRTGDWLYDSSGNKVGCECPGGSDCICVTEENHR